MNWKIAEAVATFARLAEHKGMVNSLEGNLSMMDRATGNIYITPSHKAKCFLTPEQICVIAPDGSQIGGTEKKSSEFYLHEAAYKARPDCSGVVHCHTPYLTAYALNYQDFTPRQDSFLYQIFGTMTCLPFGEHGTHEIHRGIEDALNGRPVALLGGHGVVCVGTDLEDAMGLMEAAENYAKSLWLQSKL